jgi:transposase
MNVRYRVELTQYERNALLALLSGGKHPARKLKRAQILLASDAGVGDEDIATSVGVGGSTVYRTKRRFVEDNLERALSEETRPGAERKLTGKEEALLVATACSSPPAGRARWTLTLLADALVKLTEHESLSRETVRRRLAENDLKPWRKDMWCIPQVDAEYVARMEDVLDLYAEPRDPKRPVVCFDESPIQLIGEVRRPIRAKPGQIERYDCEYRRNGTANLFVFLDVHRSWRKVKVTERRAAADFAACMRELADVHYPKRSASGWCSTTCRPTRLARSIRPSQLRKPGGSYVGWSSITSLSTPAGSTWWKSRLASWPANASIGASKATRVLSPRPPPGKSNATPNAPESNGCSQRKKPAPRWGEPIRSLMPNGPGSKSQNLCDEVLVSWRQLLESGPCS